ncbi:MAG: YiiX/YebB-like N1pC/P60 family cysteine hydrolase, partial [Candidatus Gracilibacteria bacterium]|nr:YiiX/YebB-like N1pC/P60 family cysteine hydrolase [Candidatus Gracilibacteria bacterium]
FSGTIREMAPSNIPRKKRQVITEDEARKRAVEYARQQLGEPYSLLATKWSEDKWYCSLLVYKSYSRTVTGMYLEDYDDLRAGFFVTPEDLIDSPRSKVYFTWKYGSYHV